MALVSGAYFNPWYSSSSGSGAFHKPTTFGTLASVPDWSWFDTNHGFSRDKVDKVRADLEAKVLVSFGGSATFNNFWSNFGSDPSSTAKRIDGALSGINANGIDYDYQTEMTAEVAAGLANVTKQVKSLGSKYVQTMSVLAGSYDVYEPIIDADSLDYVTVLCYDNEGMFTKDHPSGGWDWKKWMDLWRSKMAGKENKLLVGCCIQYHPSMQYYADSSLVQDVVEYCRTNGLGGVFFWWYSDDAPGAYNIGSLVEKVAS